MEYVNTQLIIKNLNDAKKAEKGELPHNEIRQVSVSAMVDTGATTLVINKKIFNELGVDFMDEQKVTFANNSKETCNLTEPVGIYCDNRFVAMQALVVDDATEVLLGVLPLEGMDFIVDTVNQKLVGAHGDEVLYLVK